jgi:hypothetical protein
LGASLEERRMKRTMKRAIKKTGLPHRIVIACLFVGVGLVGRVLAADVPTASSADISPDDSHLVYVGRFDHRDPAGPRCEWSASGVTARFRGTGIRVKLVDVGSGNDEFAVIVDHDASRVVHPGHIRRRGHPTFFKRTERIFCFPA